MKNRSMKAASHRVAHKYLLRKHGFDQYNVPALLSQLKKLLGDEVWADLKGKGFPKIINDAWGDMSKKERRSRR